MELDNSLDTEKDQEQQQELEVNMDIPTFPPKPRFMMMNQFTIPFKKRTSFRKMFA
jgi:hypothetical protein